MGCGSSAAVCCRGSSIVERDASTLEKENRKAPNGNGASLSCPSSPETVPKDGRNRSQSVPAVRDGDEDRKDWLQRNMSTRSIGRKNMFSEKRTKSILLIRNEGHVLQPEFNVEEGVPEGPLDLSTAGAQIKIPTEEIAQLTRYDPSHVDLSELTWDLDLFSKSSDWTVEAALAMYQATNVPQKFGITDTMLLTFILTVRNNYRTTPAFHNWWHAFSVMHAAWMMVMDENVRGLMTDLDVLGVVLAALCHDLDHPGVNNDFLAKTNHPLSLLYAKPILENHHWACTRKVLTECTDLLSGSKLGEREQQELLDIIHMAIMATDMACHKALCEKFQAKAIQQEEAAQALGGGQQMEAIQSTESSYGSTCSSQGRTNSLMKESRDDRMLLVEVVVHAADLSAQGMIKRVAYVFGRNVLTEFHLQYLKEHDIGCQLSAFMKDLHLPLGQAKAQISFIDFVLIPLFSILRDCFPSLGEPARRMEERMAEIDFDQVKSWPGRVEALEAMVPPDAFWEVAKQ